MPESGASFGIPNASASSSCCGLLTPPCSRCEGLKNACLVYTESWVGANVPAMAGSYRGILKGAADLLTRRREDTRGDTADKGVEIQGGQARSVEV